MSADRYNNTADEQLCRLVALGDTLAEQTLLLRHRRLVLSCSRSYFLMGGDNDDLIQEGMIGLLKAIRLYDSDRGASFATFANRCINHALISAVTAAVRNKHLPLNNSIPLQTPFSGENDPYLCVPGAESTINPEELIITQEEFFERLSATQNRLSRFEQHILGFYLKGLSYAEIAQHAGCSVKSVDNAVQRVRRKLAPPTNGSE